MADSSQRNITCVRVDRESLTVAQHGTTHTILDRTAYHDYWFLDGIHYPDCAGSAC